MLESSYTRVRISAPGMCPYCSTDGSVAVHPVGSEFCCVRAIEYYPNGTIKRVEYKDEQRPGRQAASWGDERQGSYSISAAGRPG